LSDIKLRKLCELELVPHHRAKVSKNTSYWFYNEEIMAFIALPNNHPDKVLFNLQKSRVR